MSQAETPISHVMDTAFWVANYRAEESKRKDALFQDPLASVLIGDVGEKIAAQMQGSKYVRWSVVIRTAIIDQFILDLIAQGVDTVLNLGAGLDTRPYRMNLPARLNWVEVDYENTIVMKNDKLAGERPRCKLERIAMDLADQAQRKRLLETVSAEAGKVLVLTEGVVPYLNEASVAELAEDLHQQKNFKFWIAEYLGPQLYSYFRNKKRQAQMRNAPFLFMPSDWYGFFDRNGWKPVTTKYSSEESTRLGRGIPMPWWAQIVKRIMPAKKWAELNRTSGYILFAPK